MNTADELIRSLFQKESLNDCSLDELQTIATQYPYFTPIHLLIAEKLKSSNDDLYKEKVQTLSLHFNNQLWLNFLLNGYQTEEVTELPSDLPLIDKIEPNTNNDSLPAEKDFKPDTEQPETTADENSKEPITSELKEEINEVIEIDSNNNNSEIDLVAEKQIDNAQSVEEFETRPENLSSNSGEYSEKENDVSETNEENTEQPAVEIEESLYKNEEKEIDAQDEQADEIPLSIHLPDLNAKPEGEINFQPYHTIDYFASQGIKFVGEEKPADRFGQQLKSFTEWLKAMKRLPEAEVIKLSDAPSEEKVQQLADHSLNEKEIVTESMAEVWLKQGNKEKAIEIYNKLSLLNPPKSVYFASLAEQLKNR
jgi:hypothetical protein